MNTAGNSLLITGGASGIGLALARQMAALGNQIVLCGRRRDRLEDAQQNLPGSVIFACDLTRAESRSRLVEELDAAGIYPNILVNNAGIQREISFLQGEEPLADADDEIATNLVAPLHLSAQLLPVLQKSPTAAIVNISSGLAFTPLAAVPVYCATKAAIHSWSLSLRHQLRDTSVRVFEIIPPLVTTELHAKRSTGTPVGDHVMSAEAVAAGIIQALREDNYEAPLGAAMGSYSKREALFPIINK